MPLTPEQVAMLNRKPQILPPATTLPTRARMAPASPLETASMRGRGAAGQKRAGGLRQLRGAREGLADFFTLGLQQTPDKERVIREGLGGYLVGNLLPSLAAGPVGGATRAAGGALARRLLSNSPRAVAGRVGGMSALQGATYAEEGERAEGAALGLAAAGLGGVVPRALKSVKAQNAAQASILKRASEVSEKAAKTDSPHTQTVLQGELEALGTLMEQIQDPDAFMQRVPFAHTRTAGTQRTRSREANLERLNAAYARGASQGAKTRDFTRAVRLYLDEFKDTYDLSQIAERRRKAERTKELSTAIRDRAAIRGDMEEFYALGERPPTQAEVAPVQLPPRAPMDRAPALTPEEAHLREIELPEAVAPGPQSEGASPYPMRGSQPRLRADEEPPVLPDPPPSLPRPAKRAVVDKERQQLIRTTTRLQGEQRAVEQELQAAQLRRDVPTAMALSEERDQIFEQLREARGRLEEIGVKRGAGPDALEAVLDASEHTMPPETLTARLRRLAVHKVDEGAMVERYAAVNRLWESLRPGFATEIRKDTGERISDLSLEDIMRRYGERHGDTHGALSVLIGEMQDAIHAAPESVTPVLKRMARGTLRMPSEVYAARKRVSTQKWYNATQEAADAGDAEARAKLQNLPARAAEDLTAEQQAHLEQLRGTPVRKGQDPGKVRSLDFPTKSAPTPSFTEAQLTTMSNAEARRLADSGGAQAYKDALWDRYADQWISSGAKASTWAPRLNQLGREVFTEVTGQRMPRVRGWDSPHRPAGADAAAIGVTPKDYSLEPGAIEKDLMGFERMSIAQREAFVADKKLPYLQKFVLQMGAHDPAQAAREAQRLQTATKKQRGSKRAPKAPAPKSSLPAAKEAQALKLFKEGKREALVALFDGDMAALAAFVGRHAGG